MVGFVMDIKELRKLPPEERIKKLKDLEEERKKEIEEAQQLIRESNVEIEDEEEKRRQIPIPQLRTIDIDHLFTREEKELFKVKRFISEIRKEDEADEGEERPLEETVAHEAPKLTEEQRRAAIEYQIGAFAKEKSIGEITTYATNLRNVLKYDGSALDDEQKARIQDTFESMYHALREKEEDSQAGEYGAPRKEIQKALSLIEQIRDQYRT